MNWLRGLGAVVGVLWTVTKWAFVHPVATLAIGATALLAAGIWRDEPWAGPLSQFGWYAMTAGALGYVSYGGPPRPYGVLIGGGAGGYFPWH